MAWAKSRRLLFYALFIAIPVVHYLVFYIYINFNSILMSLRVYVIEDGALVYKFAGADNFRQAFQVLRESGRKIGISLLFLAIQLFVNTPLALVFSYYLYKKRPGTEFFKVMLFMPQLLSVVVFGFLYQYLTGHVYIAFMDKLFHKEAKNLLSEISTQLGMMILFNILMSFGVNVLTYTGTMSGINQSLIESAQLDGCTPVKEFLHIVVPMTWPTIATLAVVSFAKMFTEQYNVFTVLGRTPGRADNVGYFLYTQALDSDVRWNGSPNHYAYPVLSAIGLVLTAIVLPLTLGLRKALDTYGPRVD